MISGRTSLGKLGRRPRKPFFPPAQKADDSRFRITEDSNHGRDWTKAGEPVPIPEAPMFSHQEIVPDFRASQSDFSTSRTGCFLLCFHPLAKEKTLNKNSSYTFS